VCTILLPSFQDTKEGQVWSRILPPPRFRSSVTTCRATTTLFHLSSQHTVWSRCAPRIGLDSCYKFVTFVTQRSVAVNACNSITNKTCRNNVKSTMNV
jgi:hypothetical protein